MSLRDELAGDSKAGACKFCTFLALLDPIARAEWDREIARQDDEGDYVNTHTSLMVALKRRGVKIEEASVRRHRSNHVTIR